MAKKELLYQLAQVLAMPELENEINRIFEHNIKTPVNSFLLPATRQPKTYRIPPPSYIETSWVFWGNKLQQTYKKLSKSINKWNKKLYH